MQDVFMDAVMQVLTALALAAVSAAAGWGIALLKKAQSKLHAETDKIKDDHARAAANDALTRLSNVAYTVVSSLEQTVAGQIRASVKDGTVTRDELVKVGKMAFDDIYTSLDEKTLKTLGENVKDLAPYIEKMIESKLLEIKQRAAGTAA